MKRAQHSNVLALPPLEEEFITIGIKISCRDGEDVKEFAKYIEEHGKLLCSNNNWTYGRAKFTGKSYPCLDNPDFIQFEITFYGVNNNENKDEPILMGAAKNII